MDRSGEDSYEIGYGQGDNSGEYDPNLHGDEEHGEYEGQEYDENGEFDPEEYGEGDEDMTEVDTAFAQQARKITRDLLDNLNRVRDEKKLGKVHTDLFSTQIAEDYAEILRYNDHDPAIFKELCEQYDVEGDLQLVYTISKFEEDANIIETFAQEFIDLGYLLLEVETDRKILLDPKNNNIGIGIAINEDSIILVEVFSHRMLAITRISDGEDGGIEVRGRMLVGSHGLYAVNLSYMETKKRVAEVGFEKMEYDRENREFIVFLNEIEENVGSSKKILRFYVRRDPDTIEYGKPREDKIKLKDLEFGLACPCILYPDPRYVNEDEQDRMRKENELMERRRIEEENRRIKEQEKDERKRARKFIREEIEQRKARGDDIESFISSTGRSQTSQISKSTMMKPKEQKPEGDQGGSAQDPSAQQDQSEVSPDKRDDKSQLDEESKIEADQNLGKSAIAANIREPAVSNKEIRDELEMAINQANKQLNDLEKENLDLQHKIIMMKQKSDGQMDTKQDVPMTEPKYLNTLAHVHQIRLDLKQTQDRYNRMAAELQMKLEEKQAKCYEIKKAFMDLKREVCKKAAYSRTDKPIPERKIDEWEERENIKSKELQSLRLENLRLRNQLAKNQKILKKKEELAEGLHLIDFEQLKIENQTLNEKIEERNEDLHKLKKKNTNTVQILTHYKEKLTFVIDENETLVQKGKILDEELEKERRALGDEKEKKKQLQDDIQQLKQATGIINSDSLRLDYDRLIKENKNDEKMVTYLTEKIQHMEKCIKEFNKKLAQSKIGGYSGKNTYFGGSMNGSHASINQQ